jgi:hypothetical protein
MRSLIRFIGTTTIVLAVGLFGCRHDNVAPQENTDRPILAGSLVDHPALDTVCQTADTMYLIREDNMSAYVDKCYTPAGPIICTPGQARWGYLEMVEGYLGDSNYIDCNFTMAPGWYCDFTNWEFGFGTSFQFDQNGLPIVTTDWGTLDLEDYENKWQVRVNVDVLPDPCYDVALRVAALRLNLFGAVTPGSQTTVWGENDNWDVPGHPAQSGSRWLMRFCPERCLDGPPPPPPVDTTYECRFVYTGLTCTGNNLNCLTLHPAALETGTITFLWNTGVTQQDLNVCPSGTTSYTVDVSVDGVRRHVIIFEVHTVDVSCSIPNGGGGGGGGGWSGGCGCGSGSGYGNNGGGNSTCGNGDQVTSHSGACNTNNALGSPNNSGATFTSTGHRITVKLDHTLPAGTQYKIYWRKSGSGTANLKVSESQSGSSFTQNPGSPITTTSTSYVMRTLTTAGPTRYLKLESMSGTDFYIDAITYCYTPVVPSTPGVKVCHIPPGNPNGATTVCVPYGSLGQHIANVCPANGGGGGGGGNNCGNGGGNGGYGYGGGWNGCGGWGNGGWGNGCGNNGGGSPVGHPGDLLGACGSNPCL